MRADRLITMLMLLQRRGRMSTRQLARELEVSPRTVLRDIDALGAAGVPVYSIRGPRGGFELWQGFRLDLTGLNALEVETLGVLGLPVAAEVFGMAAGAHRARLKLSGAVPEALASGMDSLREVFHHDSEAWDAEPPWDTLSFLATASRRRRVVICRDTTGGGFGRPLTLHPLGLVLKAGHWYLVAETESGFTVHEVEGLTDVSNTGQRFDRPEDFNLAAFWAGWVSRTKAGTGLGT